MESPHSPSSSPSSPSYSSSSEGHSPDGSFDSDEPRTPLAVRRALQLLNSGESELRVQAARDIRRLTKTSQRCRRQLSEAVGPLVSMLRVDSPESHEPALLALLNLAVKDEKYVTNFTSFFFLHRIINIFTFFWENWVSKKKIKFERVKDFFFGVIN